MPNPMTDSRRSARSNRAIAAWLLVCCAMLFVMVLLGGATRLTHSGLSMVDWDPITGWLPPRTEQAWQTTFERYRQYPEFEKLNRDLTLEGFKSIFWLEFIHRVWGRSIGIVFIVPFLFFLALKMVPPGLPPRLITMFVLGAAQGVLGWYMVMSGLIDRPDVSQYRLTAHLGLAFVIYAYIFWVALGLLDQARRVSGDIESHGNARSRGPLVIFSLVSLTVLSGGLVAGLDAGFAYNTFPLMGDRWVPEHILAMEPVVRNVFENIATVQFDHRVLAISSLLTILVFWGLSFRRVLPRRARLAAHTIAAAAILQVLLGIWTLLAVVPVTVAVAHQAGGLLLFTAALWLLHTFHQPG